MAYCTQCGSEMPGGSAFCAACGQQMVDPSQLTTRSGGFAIGATYQQR